MGIGTAHPPIHATTPRPRVSDDNAFAEALFRTAKYRPAFPLKGFPIFRKKYLAQSIEPVLLAECGHSSDNRFGNSTDRQCHSGAVS